MGQGPRSFEHPDDHEVWVVNGPALPARWHRLYQLHGLDHIRRKHPAFYSVLTAGDLVDPPRRLIMTDTHDEIPQAEAYPIEAVSGAFPRSYFTNSFGLVLAHAIFDGATEIMLDGVMYGLDDAQWGADEGWAVACVEYWIGVAESRFIDVTVPPGAGLFRFGDFMYGFEGPGSA